jgi:hypothetical protein
MLKITRGVLDVHRSSWKSKFKTLWNEQEVRELSSQLHSQQGAISVVITLLQM